MPHTATDDAAASTSDSIATATTPREGVVAVEEQLINFVGTIRANARAAAISIDPTLAPFGLKLLRLLRKEGPTHSSAAADLLLVDRSVISRQVKQLQELGLIECSSDPQDGRARLLALSREGTERMEASGSVGTILLRDELNSWNEEDLLRFAGYLERLISPTPKD